jgi:hypothetical protein
MRADASAALTVVLLRHDRGLASPRLFVRGGVVAEELSAPPE